MHLLSFLMLVTNTNFKNDRDNEDEDYDDKYNIFCDVNMAL